MSALCVLRFLGEDVSLQKMKQQKTKEIWVDKYNSVFLKLIT